LESNTARRHDGDPERSLATLSSESPDYASDLAATLNYMALIDLDAKRLDNACDRLKQAGTWQKKESPTALPARDCAVNGLDDHEVAAIRRHADRESDMAIALARLDRLARGMALARLLDFCNLRRGIAYRQARVRSHCAGFRPIENFADQLERRVVFAIKAKFLDRSGPCPS
jgi:hypothetical protein